ALNSCKNEEITPNRGKVKFETISVSSKIGGRIEKIYVEEGQSVKKGDTLALMNVPEVNAKMMQAEGAIMAAQGQLNLAFSGATAEQFGQIEGQLNSGQAQLEFAQESYNRLQNMFQDSLVSQQQFDEVKMKLNMAKAQVKALEAKRDEIKKGARSEQLAQAQGQLDRALGAKEEVISASDEQYLIAPADMSVETISLEEGELLTPGYTLFNGYKTNSIYFRFTIPESKIYGYEVGNELTLVNPYTKEETKAKIVAIKQLAQYADITSTSPLYELSESIYELKVVPTSDVSVQNFYTNATILIKQ
ncbi:MAG: biotin/lipoyl-binding protein, partial [Gelidibacter sp.]